MINCNQIDAPTSIILNCSPVLKIYFYKKKNIRGKNGFGSDVSASLSLTSKSSFESALLH